MTIKTIDFIDEKWLQNWLDSNHTKTWWDHVKNEYCTKPYPTPQASSAHYLGQLVIGSMSVDFYSDISYIYANGKPIFAHLNSHSACEAAFMFTLELLGPAHWHPAN